MRPRLTLNPNPNPDPNPNPKPNPNPIPNPNPNPNPYTQVSCYASAYEWAPSARARTGSLSSSVRCEAQRWPKPNPIPSPNPSPNPGRNLEPNPNQWRLPLRGAERCELQELSPL